MRRADLNMEPLDEEGKMRIGARLREFMEKDKSKVHDKSYPKFYVGQGNNF